MQAIALMTPWILLALSVVSALFTSNAFFPIREMPMLFVPSFFSSWLISELAAQHIFLQIIINLILISFGGLNTWPGWIGLGIFALSWIGLLILFHTGRKSKKVFETALQNLPPLSKFNPIPFKQLILPSMSRTSGLKTQRNIVYRTASGRRIKLDIVGPKEPGANRPVLIQIHGGAWIIGDKRQQGWPLMRHLAANGWVCFNVNYRLSPAATFPDHLIDVKYALKWIRERADEYGIDPNFVAVTGGSAGGHLTAMMALTPNDPEYQPGFEDADTTIQAAIPIYGVYDFTNRYGTFPSTFRKKILEPMVMKAFYEQEPKKFRNASPMDHINPHNPPFFIIHGDRDILAPVSDARSFSKVLRQASKAPVYYAELPGAQHAFDIFISPRTAHMATACLRFLRYNRQNLAQTKQSESISKPSVSAPETEDSILLQKQDLNR